MSRLIRALCAALIAIATTFLYSLPGRAGPDEDAVRRLLHTTFDRPESPLVVDPVVVVEEHAIAGWSQGDMGGRALLRRKSAAWSLILCSGDGIKSAEALRQTGIPAGEASALASRLADAEAKLSRERLVLFAKFEGTLMMNADGSHPPVQPGQHVQMHGMPPAASRGSSARTFKVGPIIIEEPWLRATPSGAQVAGGYMKLTNNGFQPDRLVGGTLDQAPRFEIHEMTMVDHVMRMRPLANGIEIKPGETVELKPGGYHIMGMDLQGRFEEGRTIKGTLRFEKAGVINIEYAVRPIGAGSHH
jgi:copper(I)-binding protein